jgi:hypothetical protein
MHTDQSEWDREFRNIGFPISKVLGVHDGWYFYEVERKPFGWYGIAFNESTRIVYVRFSMDCPIPPPAEMIKTMFRTVRTVIEPDGGIKYVPEIGYDKEQTELSVKIISRIENSEGIAPTLDMLVENMDAALNALYAQSGLRSL